MSSGSGTTNASKNTDEFVRNRQGFKSIVKALNSSHISIRVPPIVGTTLNHSLKEAYNGVTYDYSLAHTFVCDGVRQELQIDDRLLTSSGIRVMYQASRPITANGVVQENTYSRYYIGAFNFQTVTTMHTICTF